MRAVTGKEFVTRPAVLPGFRRNRIINADYPGIVADPLAQVGGLLLNNVDATAMDALDRFEGEYYRRHPVCVTIEPPFLVDCSVYLIVPEWLHLLSDDAWSLEEFQRVGYQRFRDTYPDF